jgi:hypothetical protein
MSSLTPSTVTLTVTPASALGRKKVCEHSERNINTIKALAIETHLTLKLFMIFE